jgi:hypothetical protein
MAAADRTENGGPTILVFRITAIMDFAHRPEF